MAAREPVEFGLLGPLVVRVGESPLRVTAPKQRALLAALLLNANRPVSPVDLAAVVWDGHPPATARVTLQNYVKRLRQALGAVGPDRLVTLRTGYAIKVQPGELDIAEFGRLRAAGLAAARSAAWPVAAAQLQAALDLWRGQPLADVPSQTLVLAEVPYLTEMRLTALETRIEADLHLGRHRELIAELQALTGAEPLRERLHELLMLGLYRAGQQAVALAAYQNVRQALVSQLGIEPGSRLHDLNLRILRSDPGLLESPAGPASADEAAGKEPGGPPPDVPRPAMLPADTPGFSGRSRELKQLSALAGRGREPAVVTIGGTAGVGKTALAVHWARQHAGRYPDGQLYVNLGGFGPTDPLTPAETLRGFLDALGIPAPRIPATLQARQALYRSLLADRTMLILLDNARDPTQIRPLLPASPATLTLITSRNELTDLAPGVRPVVLDVLTETEARQLLARRLGSARIAAERQAASELAACCARLPLALAIAGARAATHPHFALAELAAELRDTRGRLDALATGEDDTDVRAVLSWSYQHLTPAAARLFRLLGLHPGPSISTPAAASLAGLGLSRVRLLLTELTRSHLLTEPVADRFTCHDLLRAYAAEQAAASDDPAGTRVATGRMLDHYLHTAHRGAALLLGSLREPIPLGPAQPGATPEQFADSDQARAWFEAEFHVLLAAVPLAARSGFDTHAWQLPWAMTAFLDSRGHWHDQAGLQRVALAAAIRLGDTSGQAVTRRLLASACTRLADYGQATQHLNECLVLYRELGDAAGEARAHHSLCWVAGSQGRDADALHHAEQALALYRAIADRAGQANALNAVGWNHIRLGHPQRAWAFCQQSLALHRELGLRLGEAHAWDSLGFAAHQLGRLADAADCYARALSIFTGLGDRFNQAEVLSHLGDARLASGAGDARDAWQQALAILEDLHHPDAQQVRDKLRTAGPDGRAAPELISPSAGA